MSNPATNQDQQSVMSPQELNAGNPKKQSQRNWLGKAITNATSVVMLLLVLHSCTKEQWDDVIGKVPGGNLGNTPDKWYTLQVTYYPNPGWIIPKTDWLGHHDDYIIVGGRDEFKMYPAPNGFNYLQYEDGTWMSLSYNGYVYRSSEGDRVGWKIVEGKIYTDYSRWKDYPLGAKEKPDFFGFTNYYVGVGFEGVTFDSDLYWMFDCKFVPYP